MRISFKTESRRKYNCKWIKYLYAYVFVYGKYILLCVLPGEICRTVKYFYFSVKQ